MSRHESNIAKVESPFGTHYVHIEHEHGMIRSIWLSSPGKFDDTALKTFIENIMLTASKEIRDIQKRWDD